MSVNKDMIMWRSMLCRYLMEALKTQRIAVPELWTGAAYTLNSKKQVLCGRSRGKKVRVSVWSSKK